MRKTIVPAIIAQSPGELEERISRVRSHASLYQLDVMDGRFVPNHSLDFDFTVPGIGPCEAHLMVEHPLDWIRKNWEKVDTILAHLESLDPPEGMIDFLEGKRKFGLVLNPETPVAEVEKYLDRIQEVLVMTVNPGFYGSKFLPAALEKVTRLRKLRPELDIEVDGGITADTIRQADRAGANLFVSGSYIVKADDIPAAIKSLEDLLE